jgi:uncharacterized protein DUF6615
MVGLSSWVWSFLDDASDGGFSPREETLTEVLLVEMRRHATGQVATDKAIGLEESKSGADFAWAIRVRTGNWLTLLVQAKKLNPATGTFKELKDDQLGRLQARATRAGSLAVYLFYSDSALGEAGDHLAFGRCSRPISVIREHFGPPWTTRLTPAGCTLVLAADVKRLLGRGAPKATPVEIAKVGMPWECLLCPYRPSPDPLGAFSFRQEREVPEGELSADPPWVTEKPPAWAALVAEGSSPTDDPSRPIASYYLVTNPNYDVD